MQFKALCMPPGNSGSLLTKMLRIMKLTAIILFTACMQVSAEGLAQKVTLSEKNAKLEKVFREIKKQTGYVFFFDEAWIKQANKVTIEVKEAPLLSALDLCFKDQLLTYTIVEKTIVVKQKEQPKEELKTEKPLPPPSIEIKGVVTDENNKPLPGATIKLKGTNKGTNSDDAGNFALDVPDAGGILIVSYVGYQTVEVPVSKTGAIKIVLKQADATVGEVVVMGYGSVRKSDLTGSVATIKSKELAAYPTVSAEQAIQGRAAGVLVQSNNGNPGGTYKIRIRGGTSLNASSDPIFVVDGFVGANLPPAEDIESIEILKDASATSIYGSRGANGVIMITTKRGKAGKTKVDINLSSSTQKEINRLPLLNGTQFTDYIKEIDPAYSSGNQNTDWQDLILQKGTIQNAQVAVSGGTDAVRYYVSGAYYDQKGIIINSNFKRYSVTSNVEIAATNWLKLGLNLYLGSFKSSDIQTQEGSGGAGTGVISSAFKFGPDQPVYKPNGLYTRSVFGEPIDNPVAIANDWEKESIGSYNQYNFYADINVVKNLKFKSTVGASSNSGRTGEFIPSTLVAGSGANGDASVNGNGNKNFSSENYLTYTNTFSKNHKVSVLGGVSYQKNKNEDFGARSQDFLTNSVSFWNLSAGSVSLPGFSNLTESQLASFYGRANYGFSDKYLLTVTARYDGSSNFSKNHKWAFFPSAAFAWNMHTEKFMQKISAINSFKWRVSYGLTGNQAIAPYQTLARLSSVYTFINGSPVNAVRPTSVANDDLKWETTEQADIGVDIGILKNRITLTADYYKSVTSDLLMDLPLPQYSGYSSQLKNIGKIENKGFEFALGTKNFVGAFQWNTDFNISFNRNKVLELPGGNDIIYASVPGHFIGVNSAQILRVGQPIGSFYGWKYDGVYQAGDIFIPGAGFETSPGGEKYRDIGGAKDAKGNPIPDGKLNDDDRTIIGNPNPDFMWGLNNTFNYKNFDLNIFFQGSQGNDLLSFSLLELELISGVNNSTTEALKRWTPTNTNTNVPKVSNGRPTRASSRWVMDGSYARLKNISLGYNLPDNTVKKLHLQRLHFYLSAQNILTFTKYRGYDPEVNYRSSNLNAGLDYGSYPNAKSFTAGLNITL